MSPSAKKTIVFLLTTWCWLVAGSAMAKPAAIPVEPFPPGSQDEAGLNAGLPAAELGYHPSDDGSWGESWFMVALNEAGDEVWVLFSVSNYHPTQNHTGTVDLYFYPAAGSKSHGHSEFASKEVKGDLDKLRIALGSNVIEGAPPRYRINASVGDVGLDLSFDAATPGFLLGQSPVYFDKDRSGYWMAPVIAPRARVSGTVTIKGKSTSFSGLGYFDHGRSTIKVPEFSRWWYVIRMFQDDFSLGAMTMVMKDAYAPARATVIHLTQGDKVILNSGALTMTPSGNVAEPKSNITYPNQFELAYQDADTRFSGTVKLQRLVDGFNVLEQLSWLVRNLVKALYTNPWQFRFEGEGSFTLERQGQQRTISGRIIGEIHHYK